MTEHEDPVSLELTLVDVAEFEPEHFEAEIGAALDGERIDRAISLLTGLARGEARQLVEDGAVAINSARATSAHRRVHAGELVEVVLPEPAAFEPLAPSAAIAARLHIVYEDDAIVVIDKPPGLVVHPGAGHRDDTLVAGLLFRYPDLVAAVAAGDADPLRPGIVHRLDKDTSGLLVVARTPHAHAHLVEQLASRRMGRTYRTLVLGHLDADEGLIDAPIGRSAHDPTRMAVSVSGKPARSGYRVLRRYETPIPTTELEVRLETGRTHQIRVHLAAIEHPVAGDRRYRGSARELAIARPFLHAAELRLEHPDTSEQLTFTSPLPEDLRAILDGLS